MSLLDALLDDLDDSHLEMLAAKLAPILASRLSTDQATSRWLRGADAIAEYIGAPRSRVYALASARRIPVHRDGSALIALTSDLDQWIRAGGGKRP